jgi:hypothetical protein
MAKCKSGWYPQGNGQNGIHDLSITNMPLVDDPKDGT